MPLKSILVFLFVIFAFASCKKNEEPIGELANGLVGNWIEPDFHDTLVTYVRSPGLLKNGYGLAFKNGSDLVERKNSGSCDTPPIHYADFNGSWIENDSIIYISVGYWGGIAEYRWKIVSLNSQYLTIIKLEERYQH